MGKYVGGYHTLQPKQNTFGKVVENISNDMKVQSAQKIINDPNATPMQQAMALASLNQEKLGVEVFKKAANQSTLAGIEERLSQNLGIAPPTPVEAPRDRSWRDQAISGMTPPIRDASQDTVAQPGAEGAGSPTQPGFSVNGPQNASRNPTALNMPSAPPLRQPPAQGAPQPQQIDPEREAAAYEQAAQEAAPFNPSVAARYENKAKEIKKDVRLAKEFQFKEAQAAEKSEREIRKENQTYIDKTTDSFKAVKNQEAILNHMTDLSERGNLTTPLMATLLSKLHMPIGILNNPDSEEFEKLSNNLTRDITKFYGARINMQEFSNFLKQIPSLMNSEEGKLRVTDNLKRMLEPAKLEYQTMSQIIAENNGKTPPNLNFQVSQRMEPVLDKWANEINHNMNPARVPNGSVAIIGPDGNRYAIPKEQVQDALANGGKLE